MSRAPADLLAQANRGFRRLNRSASGEENRGRSDGCDWWMVHAKGLLGGRQANVM